MRRLLVPCSFAILALLSTTDTTANNAVAANKAAGASKAASPSKAAAASKASKGEVSFKQGDQSETLPLAEAEFEKMEMPTVGLHYSANLTFKNKAGDRFLINIMYKGPGAVPQEMIVGLYADTKAQGISNYSMAAKSKCNMTLTKATEKEVEGTADCPTLADASGKAGGKPVTNIRFSAKSE